MAIVEAPIRAGAALEVGENEDDDEAARVTPLDMAIEKGHAEVVSLLEAAALGLQSGE